MYKKGLLYIIALSLGSCSFLKKEDKDTRVKIAKVDTVFLYKQDVIKFLPKNYKQKDSALLVNNFINTWAKKQLLLNKAKLNLKNKAIDIDELVNKYREDLLINKYREAVVTQNLDTIVSEHDVDFFYKKNKRTLKLNEELLMLKFIEIDKDIIDRDKIEKLFASDKKEDLDTLIARELEFKSFYFNDSIWIRYSDVLTRIPSLKKEDLKVNTKNNYLVKKDSINVYLIKIKKVLKRNSISPKSYVIPTIKQMILHTRKLKLLKEIEKTLLNDANKNGQYEVYK